MTSALDLITSSARLIGVVRKNESLTADEAVDGLEVLNDMIDSWSNNGLTIVSRVLESFSINGAMTYTIGAGQTLNTVRPIAIISATFNLGGVDYPMEIITDEEFQNIPYKTVASSNPFYLNYNNAYPYGTIRLWPQGTGTLTLLSEKPLTELASLSTTIDLPVGWKKALRSNLALDLAAEYGVKAPAEIIKMAGDSKSSIELAIAKNRPIKLDRPLFRRYDIYGDI